MFSNFLSKIVPFMRYVEKYCSAGQTDDNMALAQCTLDTQGYKRTLRIRITSCFCTATMFTQTCLNVRLHKRCLSCNLHFNHL